MNRTKIEIDNHTWNSVPGYPGYSVTKTGLIKGPRRILRPMEAESCHLYVIAYHEKKGRKLFVHKAVLLAFKGPCPNSCESRHLDGNPKNNYADNLEWGTRIEQRLDARRHGTLPIGERSGTCKLTEEQVRLIKISMKSSRNLGREFGVSHTTILAARNGHHWGHLHE